MKLFLGLVALVLASPMAARADHTVPDGLVQRLHQDTHQLEYQVRNSWLNYNVKNAVYRFTYDVSAFAQCAGGIGWDHTLPGHCEVYEQRLRSSWYPVDRYLYDTYYDFPYVYQAYRAVQNDLRYLD